MIYEHEIEWAAAVMTLGIGLFANGAESNFFRVSFKHSQQNKKIKVKENPARYKHVCAGDLPS